MIIAILYFYYNPNTTFFPKCPLYSMTGVYCPGCGSQRALHDLLHLNFMGVLKQNVLFLFGGILLSYYIVVNVLNTVFGKKIKNFLQHKKAPIVLLVLVITFWVLRNIPVHPFTLLAPE